MVTFDPSLQLGTGYSYSGNRATKTSAAGWTGTARTADLGDPTSSTITLEFPAYSTGATGGNFYLGLSRGTHTVYDEAVLDYGLYFYDTDARILNNGSIQDTIATTASDVWKMEISASDVKYYKNNLIQYTDTTTVPSDTYYGAGGGYYQNMYGELTDTASAPTSPGLPPEPITMRFY